MNSYIYAAPCHFGLESVLKREIQGLGCKIVSVDDGRVTFEGDADTAAAANIKLRTAERILLLVDEFRAVTYDELFEKTKAVCWEEFLPRDAKFWVAKASSVKSALFSPSDIQRIIKKAMADRMSAHYGYRWAPETGAAYPLRVAIRKDIVTLGLDTTGTSLHKRGYRISPVIAPISETLAAALILLTPWRQGRILVDPFCGSGTFPIEAAMIAGNIAPGVNREFLSEKWNSILPEDSFRRAREQARAEEIPVTDTDIQGYDIDPKAVKAARENAREAGVLSYLHFQRRAVVDLSHSGKYGFIITNPPYGERIEDRANLPELYGALGEAYRKLDTWSMYVITAYDQAESGIGLRSSKNRKIYNGMMKTYLYEYIGPKPPRKPREGRT